MTFDCTDFPPTYVNQWNVPCEDTSTLGACGFDDRMHRRLLLDAHIHRLWMALPDQSRNWALPLNKPLGTSRIRVKAVTDAGNLEADLDLPN